jgi:hypothetical protein
MLKLFYMNKQVAATSNINLAVGHKILLKVLLLLAEDLPPLQNCF